nr:hypothetical protein [uncultured Butyrivibrio sp.]
MNKKQLLIIAVLGILAVKAWHRINNDGDMDEGFLSTRDIIKREGLFPFLKSRILTPKEVVATIKDLNESGDGLKINTLSEFLLHARLVNSKEIENYDTYNGYEF